MYVNIINSYRNVIAIADENLVGRKFEEGDKQLDVKESFYKNEEGKNYSQDEVKEIIKKWLHEDATFNIVGEKSVSLAIEIGLLTQESIGKIDSIPYALVLL